MGIIIRVTRKRVFFAILTAVVLFVALGSFTVVYTATPKSCASCHNMVPFYETWKASVHHDIACVNCHFPPGVEGDLDRQLAGLSQVLSYMTTAAKEGGRMEAQVPDRGCLASGCHERSALRKPLAFRKYVLDFRHDLHFGPLGNGIELKCASCHMRTGNGKHFSVNPETCWICHFETSDGKVGEGKERCLECHGLALRLNRNLPEDHTRTLKEGIACEVCHGSMVEGGSGVSATTCRRCHVEGEPKASLADPDALHDVHTQKVKVDCSACHNAPKHVSRTRLGAEVPACATCHPQYHEAQSMLWSGTGFPGVAERPNPMFPSGLTCQACHTSLTASHGLKEIGETKKTTAESCRVCHPSESQGDFAALVGPWKRVSAENLGQLTALYAGAADRLKAAEGEPGRLYREGVKELDLLKAGGPVHNVWFARDVTYRILDDLRTALAAVDPSAPAPKIEDRSSPIPDECVRCHFGVPEELTVSGRPFSHRRHTLEGGVGCFSCHSHLEEGHGVTRVKSEDECSACHHGPASEGTDGKRDSARCAACHEIQARIYDGRWERPAAPKPNVMAAEVHCVMCHFPAGATRPIRPAEKDCRSCHKEGDVAALLPTFRENIGSRLAAVKSELARAVAKEGLTEEDRALIAHVRRSLATLESDGSGGIHNPALVDDVLTGFLSKLKEITDR